jgi:acyl-CoA thioesterase I
MTPRSVPVGKLVALFICLSLLPAALVHVTSSIAPAGKRDGPMKIHIVPIGDSITQGGRRDRPEYSYRYPLFYMLRDAGYGVDFVGSLHTGLHEDAVWPAQGGVPFDPNHEGHYGGTTAQVRDYLREVVPIYRAAPDIALIQLGSNDVDAPDYTKAIIEPLKDIVALLRESNPRVVILVGHLLESSKRAKVIRALMEEMAHEIDTQKSPVVTVHHYEGWWERPGLPWSDTFDWAHPNPKGQQKMADKWFAAMKPYIKQFRID